MYDLLASPDLQGAPTKKTIPKKKMLYFSHDCMDLHTLCVSIRTTYTVNFIKITDVVLQIQQFEL